MSAPLVCVNGHAMDDGLFECPCCSAYRPSGCITPGMTVTQQQNAIRRALDAEIDARDLTEPIQWRPSRRTKGSR